MTDRTDALTLTYEPMRGPPRRVIFEPRSDGRWCKRVREWSGCQWRETGSELVEDVTIRDDRPHGLSCAGP